MAYGTLNAGTITPGSGNTLAISEAVTVPTPTATTHAATKSYVDTAATQATTAAQGVGTGNTPEFAGVKITASGGINFSAYATSGNPSSNLLDDYEEGTWTPVIADAVSGGNEATPDAGGQTGLYTKIGDTVHATARYLMTNVTGLTTTNSLYMTGFPFTVDYTTGSAGIIYIGTATIVGTFTKPGIVIVMVGNNVGGYFGQKTNADHYNLESILVSATQYPASTDYRINVTYKVA